MHSDSFDNYADPTDFVTGLTSNMITFSTSQSTRQFFFRTIEDDVQEGTECVYFLLEANDNFVLISNENGTLTVCIEEDDCK